MSRKARVTTGDGRTFLIGTTTDITGQKRRQSELAEARRQADMVRADLESVIEALDMSVVVVDGQTPHRDDQRRLLPHLGPGERVDDLVGRPLRSMMDAKRHDLIHDVAGRRAGRTTSSRAAGGNPSRQCPRPGRWSCWTGARLIYSVHSLSADRRMICHFDVSGQKASERQIAQAKAELEATSATLRKATAAMAQGLCIYDDDDPAHQRRLPRDGRPRAGRDSAGQRPLPT